MELSGRFEITRDYNNVGLTRKVDNMSGREEIMICSNIF